MPGASRTTCYYCLGPKADVNTVLAVIDLEGIALSMFCCKCIKQHRWYDIAITDMYAGPVQMYQTGMLVCTSLQNDMTAG